MARQTKFAPIETSAGWRLNVPAKFTESGKRERHFFRTQREAMAAAKELRRAAAEFGTRAQAIRPSLAEDATAAAEVLAPHGITLLEAARIVASIRDREAASMPLCGALDAWLVDCEVLRTRTQQGYRHTANRLRALSGRVMATLGAEELQSVIAPPGTPPTAARGHLRNARAFWRWAAERGWCDREIIARVKLAKTRTDSPEITFLTVAEARHLLLTAENHFPQAVATYALQLFAGIRAEEIPRLRAEHVNPEGINITGEVAKKGRRRHITMNETLKVWLAAFPFNPCPNWKRVNRACRYLAGWKLAPDPDLVPAKLIRKPAELASADPWPQNAIRHTHATFAVAVGVPLERLLFEFGHTQSPAVLRQNYAGRASKKAAIEFFGIRPGGKIAAATLEPVESEVA